jgi:hypothetical protein
MAASGSDTLIRRRHVIYVEGYDPQGAEGYYRLFSRSFGRFLKNWPIDAKIGDLQIDSDDFAHWDVATAGPNWRVQTRYEFLRQERMIRANMAKPMWRQVPHALGWMLNYLYTGTLFRVYRASLRYGVVLAHFQLLLLHWLAASALVGWVVGFLLSRLIPMPVFLVFIAGLAAAVGSFALLRPLADKFFVVQINSHWPHLLPFCRGEPSCFDHFVEACAHRLVEAARGRTAEEIVVVGHSGGGVLAPAVVKRALEIDGSLGTYGPRVVLLTPGSLMPGIGVHRHASRVRADIRRIAIEPTILWIDAQARADWLNFYDFDPVDGIGVDAGALRCNPLIWKVRLRDMLAPAFYRKIRFNLFRTHYQFIMANDMRAPYEYMMLVCGPLPVEQWARDGVSMLKRFAPDAKYYPVAAA